MNKVNIKYVVAEYFQRPNIQPTTSKLLPGKVES